LPSIGVYSPREEGRRFKETASPFRRNGIAVPAQRHHRSGETASNVPHAAAKRRSKTTPISPGRNEKAGGMKEASRTIAEATKGQPSENARIAAKRTRKNFRQSVSQCLHFAYRRAAYGPPRGRQGTGPEERDNWDKWDKRDAAPNPAHPVNPV